MERNKTGKYFKYAIGEIVLVVIGILLPLALITGTKIEIKRRKRLKYLKK